MSEKRNAHTVETLWYTRCPVPTPLGLAAQLGWFGEEFASEGIHIKTLQETADPELRESHYDHRLDNSFRQGGSVPAIWAKANGRDTRVIALNWLDEYQAILALPDSGIRTPRDLRGRRVGLPVHKNSIDFQRAGALRGFVVALELEGLSHRDVEFVDLPAHPPLGAHTIDPRVPTSAPRRPGGAYTAELYALIRREVDAIYVKGAHGAQLAHQLRAHVVTDISRHPDPLARTNNSAPRPVTVDSALLAARPDLVARFLARVIAIGPWAERNAADAVAYIARETGSTETWVRYAYGNDVHRRLHNHLDESAVAGLNAFKNFLFEWKFIPADFDARAWIDPLPLAQAQDYVRRQIA